MFASRFSTRPKSTGRDRIATQAALQIDSTDATEIDRTRPNRRDRNRQDATESTRPKSTGRDRIGRPPIPFSVGRAVLDPRSLNFFALHCAFLQKSCKKEGVFFALHCEEGGRAKSHTFFIEKSYFFIEKSEKSQRKVREKSEKSHNNVIIMS